MAGGMDSLESIHGLLKSLKIRALNAQGKSNRRKKNPKLSVSGSMCLSAERSWGRGGMLRRGLLLCMCASEATSSVYSTLHYRLFLSLRRPAIPMELLNNLWGPGTE